MRSANEAGRALSTDPRLPFTLGRSSLGLAELARQDEDLDEAWELAHDSLEVLDDYGDRVGAAAALETIADLAVALGEPERSLRLLAASQRFHTDTGIARFPFRPTASNVPSTPHRPRWTPPTRPHAGTPAASCRWPTRSPMPAAGGASVNARSSAGRH